MEPSQEPQLRVAHSIAEWDPVPAILACLFAVLATTLALTLNSALAVAGPPHPTVQTVNPNVAPWYELTILPRIGETVAREIVRHRESVAQGQDALAQEQASLAQNPFSSAADLDDVRGIGPITLRRIAPYLRFEGR